MQAKSAPVRGVPQRKCACGNHTAGAGECATCRQPQSLLQRQGATPGQTPVMAGSPATAVGGFDLSGVTAQSSRDAAATRQGAQTGLPPRLKAGIEALSGLAMDDVRVHNNSEKPAQWQALAYAQGTDIFVGPGQERHLPHEVWHVVQQKQGRVNPTGQVQGVTINDDVNLEQEANLMGTQAIQGQGAERQDKQKLDSTRVRLGPTSPIQFAKGDSCYCPGWGTLSPYQAKPEDIVPVGSGELFTPTQIKYVQGLNAAKSKSGPVTPKLQSYNDSDSTGGALVTKDEVGHLLAEVDHIVPKESGGCNSVKNAQVISAYENGTLKGTTYPYGGYNGWSVFDPTQNVWHKDKATAIAQGATNAHLL